MRRQICHFVDVRSKKGKNLATLQIFTLNMMLVISLLILQSDCVKAKLSASSSVTRQPAASPSSCYE